MLITDEDDCSARDATTLFNPDETEWHGPLGPISSFRCFEFGVLCEPPDTTRLEGPRFDCRPSDDPGSLLHPIRRYVDFLREIRPSHRLMVAAIAGPVPDDVAAHPPNVCPA